MVTITSWPSKFISKQSRSVTVVNITFVIKSSCGISMVSLGLFLKSITPYCHKQIATEADWFQLASYNIKYYAIRLNIEFIIFFFIFCHSLTLPLFKALTTLSNSKVRRHFGDGKCVKKTKGRETIDWHRAIRIKPWQTQDLSLQY